MGLWSEDRLLKDLDALGETADQVRMSLVQCGIKLSCPLGKHSGSNCPVAEYLRSMGWLGVQVDAGFVSTVSDVDGINCVITPEPVSEFIMDFDDNFSEDRFQAFRHS